MLPSSVVPEVLQSVTPVWEATYTDKQWLTLYRWYEFCKGIDFARYALIYEVNRYIQIRDYYDEGEDKFLYCYNEDGSLTQRGARLRGWTRAQHQLHLASYRSAE